MTHEPKRTEIGTNENLVKSEESVLAAASDRAGQDIIRAVSEPMERYTLPDGTIQMMTHDDYVEAMQSYKTTR